MVGLKWGKGMASRLLSTDSVVLVGKEPTRMLFHQSDSQYVG
jgi:hypothetical protein